MHLKKLKTKDNILKIVVIVLATTLSSTNFYFAIRYLKDMIIENYDNYSRH